ncbi:MAG: chromosome segregation protein SMC [Actinobacteria bacterium]|nr:chromosome segregation protein SMC [Actinomycetota bacterium]
MLLKTLSLAGFKSFADRTRLDFESGVNVVVGPNGSGKSNLLDALAWVMGTQATRVLRTEKMEDVIFAGTATRPALGRAEVALTLDNSDGFLPLDVAEVTMTRRLYRDGTSEYLLNGAPCRLLDLSELLSDGGVGKHQHVLVGQGQIGEILNARPEEHRAVIEEAAGVTKHRGRRDRSIRRLEQTDIDVARLHDLLDASRKRMRPLKRQANAAEKHESVRADITALRLWIGGEALRAITTRLDQAETEQRVLDTSINNEVTRLEAIRSGLDALSAAATQVGRELERDTSAAARLETVAERLQRIAQVSRERRYALESRLKGVDERRSDLDQEIAFLEADLVTARIEAETAHANADRCEVALQALEDEERSLAEQAQLPAEGLVANLRGDLRALETAAERDRRETEHVDRRRLVVEERLESEREDARQLIERIQDTDIEVGKVQIAHEAAARERDLAEQANEAAQEAFAEARFAVAEAQARVDAVEAALAGIGDPLARSHAEDADGVVGGLAQLLDATQDNAAAVDAALGSWRDAYVTTDAKFDDVVASLKSAGLGGVSFVAERRSAGDVPARSVATSLGLVALADTLGANARSDLAAHLLGDVVLVEGWSTGWDLVRKHPHLRAVTPEGDVITMRLAEPDGAGPAAMEAARVALEIAETDLVSVRLVHDQVKQAYAETRRTDRAALEALESAEALLAGFTETLAMNERTQAQGIAELERLDERRLALFEAAEARDERIAEMRVRVEQFAGEERARQDAWDALNRRREDVARRRDEARTKRQEAAAVVAGIAERCLQTESRLGSAQTERQSVDTQPIDPSVVELLSVVETRARRGGELVVDHIEALRERQRALRERVGEADTRLTDAHSEERQLERSVSESKDRANKLAIETAELRVRHESVAEGLRRDADASEEEALAAPRPEIDEDDSLEEILVSREAQLRRMGPINPLAAIEYQELSQEVDTLEAQLGDLEESRNELRKVITALDDEMTIMYRAAFEEISALYEENFSLVFPGGKGQLRMLDPTDALESGIEIEAQPLGKKVGRLSLLSGGERSLAALAFLFAVFRARPSPFYVLDEVEAALDDANLRRFLRLVDTLRGSAQVVIITHQQQTMEAGDILYGVTMEPGESSRVLAKKLDRTKVS